MNPKISVIIPVYNVKEYLQEAIDSIIVQKEYLYEIIIIDDGSTDGSGELLDNLYGKIDIIKIVHKANEGQGIARNLGTDISSGNFIYYFDSDDVSKDGIFKKFFDLISNQPKLEILCFSGETFLDKNYPIQNVTNLGLISEKVYKRKFETSCNSGEEAYILLSNNQTFFPGPPLYIFKKSILEKNGIKFRAIRYEDEEFTIKIFLKAGQTYICKDVYFNRRVREGSTMQLNRSFKDVLGYIKTIETLVQLKNHDYLKHETKELLMKKILNLIRDLIIMKTQHNLKLSKEEKKIYKTSLKPYILRNKDLLTFYYKYPLEYKLRKFKKQIFS